MSSRNWSGRAVSVAAASSSSPPPISFASTSSVSSQRRRSSAAHAPPAAPPPNLPIPSVPGPISLAYRTVPSDYPEDPPITMNGQATHITSSVRPGASHNLTAVLSFPNASTPHDPTAGPLIEDLSDPPPPSLLSASSSSVMETNHDSHEHLVPPRGSRTHREQKLPSSRRALTRALELAREAVKLDSTNDNPEAAVQAYGRSVALLSEVMERVRRGEDSTDSHRRRRRRSVAAQEEEIRRLQNIVRETSASLAHLLSY
jgi:hypothetical protein